MTWLFFKAVASENSFGIKPLSAANSRVSSRTAAAGNVGTAIVVRLAICGRSRTDAVIRNWIGLKSRESVICLMSSYHYSTCHPAPPLFFNSFPTNRRSSLLTLRAIFRLVSSLTQWGYRVFMKIALFWAYDNSNLRWKLHFKNSLKVQLWMQNMH